MDPNVMAAVIAGIVSFFGFCFTKWATKKEIEAERKIFEEKIRNNYTEKLYEIRLEKYPEAFTITDKLGKTLKLSSYEFYKATSEKRMKLINWKSGVVNIILSECSLKAYYTLLETLKVKPEKNEEYSVKQIGEIYLKRTAFRNVLREDVGLLYNFEKNNENS